MKILHIVNDRMTDLAQRIIDAQAKEHEVKVIELARKEISYDALVQEVFSHDRVISW